MLKIPTIIYLLATGLGFGTFILFLLAYYYANENNNERLTYIVFSLFCLTVTEFVFTQAMIFNSTNFSDGLLWHRVQHVGAVWIPSLFLHFSQIITRTRKKQKILNIFYLISLIFLTISFSDIFIAPIQNTSAVNGLEGSAGLMYYPFSLFVMVGLIMVIYTFISAYRETTNPSLKLRLKYIIRASVVLNITGLLDILVVVGVRSGFSTVPAGFMTFCLFIAIIIGVDLGYFKNLAEIREKKLILDRLDTSKHVVSLFLHDIRHIVATFRLYIYHHKNGNLKNPEVQYNRLIERFRRCEDFLKNVLSPEFTEYIFEEVDIVGFINKRIDDLYLFNQKNIIVKTHFKVRALNLKVDKEKFEKVINVILKNAYDALLKNGEIVVSIAKQKKSAIIKISDNGIGMTDEELEKIGRPRFSTKGDDGEGLGIYTSISVIHNHKGNLKIDSKKDLGSNFIIELPLVRETEFNQNIEVPLVQSAI